MYQKKAGHTVLNCINYEQCNILILIDIKMLHKPARITSNIVFFFIKNTLLLLCKKMYFFKKA